MVSTRLLIRAREAADFLAMVGSPTRLLILAHLLDGEVTVNALVDRIEVSQSSLSQHLAKLRMFGLVDTRRDSQFIYYSCKSKAVRQLLLTLEALYGVADDSARTITPWPGPPGWLDIPRPANAFSEARAKRGAP